MKKIALAEVKDHLSHYLREAEKEQIIITKHGKPAGVLIGFETEDEWFDYRLQNDPIFLRRIAEARASFRAGKGISWDEIKGEEDRRTSASRRRPKGRA
jgi:prevent-host-death family protein